MLLFLFLVCVFFEHGTRAVLYINPAHPAFDMNLYENVLDIEMCKKHLDYIKGNANLYFKFLDYGLKIPKDISQGNIMEFGSYHACLSLREETDVDVIHGKYCMLKVPIEQILNAEINHLPDGPNINMTSLSDKNYKMIQNFQSYLESNGIVFGGSKRLKNNWRENDETINLSHISIKMGICLPKACTTHETLEKLYFNITYVNFDYEEEYCRLPNDKPWTPADVVAITLLSFIGLITVLSTSYDIYYCVVNNKASKTPNPYLRAFSVYTNTRRLLTYTTVPGAIQCIDGIRAFSMAWVILGHTFLVASSGGYVSNLLDTANWSTSAKSLWLTSAPVTVDTFFTLSGILVVYSTAGKLNGVALLKNLHLFYLNRLLRLFPILAFSVLLQISVLHRIADGPDWTSVATQVNDCRAYWWTNFLYVQNYVNHYSMCIQHSWYLTVDMQLYFISPLVLYWVLSGKERQAWMGLIAGLVISLTASTVYIFTQNFSLMYSTDPEQRLRYNRDYYINTLTRAPPFFVGMIYGYLLHLGRRRNILISKALVALLWIISGAIAALVIYTYYYQTNYAGTNQTVDNLINAFTRPAWALVIGWLIFACAHGYGGVINWVLSLKELKVLSRVSYSMYIIHYPIMYVYVGAAVVPFHFDVLSWVHTFFSHIILSFICGFLITLLVDSPASIFIKLLLGKGKRLPKDSEMDATTNHYASSMRNI